MLLIILIVGAFALAAVGGAWLLKDTGYVLINYGGYIVETSLLALVLATLATLLVTWLVLRLVRGTVQAPVRAKHALARRRRDRARESFLDGLEKLYESRLQEAEVDLVRRAAQHDHAVLNYLAAAEAADGVDAPDRRDHYLQLAIAADPTHEIPVLLKQADLQLHGKRYAEALATLGRLQDLEPHHPGIQRRLIDVYEATGEWEQLRQLLPQVSHARVIDQERWTRLHHTAHIKLLEASAKNNDAKALTGAWTSLPKKLKNEPAIARRYALLLSQVDANEAALDQTETAMQHGWDAKLALAYGNIHTDNTTRQLATVEQWIQKFDEKPELLLVAGRLCLRNQLWGRARNYLESSLSKRQAPDTYFALARLAEETDEPLQATEHYRRGLELALT